MQADKITLKLTKKLLGIVNKQDYKQLQELNPSRNEASNKRIFTHLRSLQEYGFITVLENQSGNDYITPAKIETKGKDFYEILSDEIIYTAIENQYGGAFLAELLPDLYQFGFNLLLAKVDKEQIEESRSDQKENTSTIENLNVKKDEPSGTNPNGKSNHDNWVEDKLLEGITLKEAKQRLIEFARGQIPDNVRYVVRIPATSSSNILYLQNTDRPDVLKIVDEEFGQKTVSTSIDKNSDLNGMQTVSTFQIKASEHSLLRENIVNKSLTEYFLNEEKIIANNIKVGITNDKSRIAILIRKYQKQNKSQVQETFDNTFDPSVETITIKNQLQLATLNSDSERGGEDLLGFDQDINAFAAIIALKELTPPLAIALFGEWGSGKSFFMQSLSNKIDFISKNQSFKNESGGGLQNDEGRKEPFCKGVCQIHFNAWSYTDTNLWASLVSGIFEGLESYISKNKKKEVKKDKIEKELSQKLELAREQESKLVKIKEAKQKEVESLEAQRDTKTKEENAAIERIKTLTLGSLIEKAKKELEATPTFNALKGSVEKFGISDQKIRKWAPSNVLRELTSWKTFALIFFKVRPWQWFKFLGIVALFFLSPFIINLTRLNWDLTLFSTLGISGTAIIAVWEKAKQSLNKLNPIITEVVNYKDQYETRMADLISARDQQVESEKLKIIQGQMEITHINSQLDVIQKEISQLEYSLKSSLSQKALYSFIVERSKSQDYERHLGIISTIRRDFETLSELFLGNISEIKTHGNDINHSEDEKQRSNQEFRDQFDQPLERIVLYVDDLDRCPEDRVVEVLEAVNLLMAFPLFVVVVGVDPRWVENALIQKYQLQFTGQLRGQTKTGNKSLKVIQASDYLEKIFQIPFHLKSASDESVKDMITSLIGPSIQNKIKDIELSTNASFSRKAMKPDGTMHIPQSLSSTVEGVIPRVEIEDYSSSSKYSSEITPEVLSIDNIELNYMRELSWVIGNTPRTVKRFVNTYRIIRAHEGLSYKNDDEKSELLALMFLLALRIGRWKNLYSDMKATKSMLSSDMTFGTLLDEILKALKNKLKAKIDVKKDSVYWDFLMGLIKMDEFEKIRLMKVSQLYYHYEFVERFSFQTSKITSYPDFEDKELM
jgi:hypothetical protein